MKRIIALVFLGVFLSYGMAFADVIFHDGFEYTDSPENHGWSFVDVDLPGEVYTTTTQSHGGSYSLKLDNHDDQVGIWHLFNDLAITGDTTASIWFYDEMNTGSNRDLEARLFLEQAHQQRLK